MKAYNKVRFTLVNTDLNKGYNKAGVTGIASGRDFKSEADVLDFAKAIKVAVKGAVKIVRVGYNTVKNEDGSYATEKILLDPKTMKPLALKGDA